MENRTIINDAFKGWLHSTYKRSVAIQLCQTLERVEVFLRETAILKGSFFDLRQDAMARCLGDLNRNRVFKFRNREAMPWLGKLSNALSVFVSSDIYGNAVRRFACSTGCATDNKKGPEESDIPVIISSAGFVAESEKQFPDSPAVQSRGACFYRAWNHCRLDRVIRLSPLYAGFDIVDLLQRPLQQRSIHFQLTQTIHSSSPTAIFCAWR